ncbi:AzlC family ABC transporter permease [Paenibacillus lentus]|uniref:Branched-chain amino acid ABC transporter permease n=1 Tax=Paenibacillus lentus TaxID=1338368 RepID=A0A3Q8SDX5_9BACL|nr:AzlC family ABC transporter permease [Paenibacillus lentus]AZK48327.1 branched-chain amino acid ABC transporter permease [Paenibacillus lentus]
MSRQDKIALALKEVLPIVLAYFPLSITFGVLAAASGVPWYVSVFSSVWIYSGGAQFMLISMIETATAPVTIIATILLVNMRHVLYGATMGPYLAHWREPLKWLAALGLTDESFVVTSNRAAAGERLTPSYYLTFALAAYGSWISGTIVGAGIGGIVPSEAATVLSFALPALFLALLFGGERTLPHLLAACTGAALATLAGLLNLGGIGLIVGGIIGATAGQMLGRKRIKPIRS